MPYNKELFGKKGRKGLEKFTKELRRGSKVPKKIHHTEEMYTALTPVTAVPVHAQARGSRYHGAFAIIKSPRA